MKNKSITMLLAAIIVCLSSAFSFYNKINVEATPTAAKATTYFVYTGPVFPGATLSDIRNPSNYTLLTGGTDIYEICNGSSYLCGIYAEQSINPNRPNINSTKAIYDELQTYFLTGGSVHNSTIIEKEEL